MAFLKNPLNGDIPDVPEVQKALDTLKEISANEEEREIYNLSQQTEFGYISEKNVAVINALEKGGKKDARDKAIETAKSALAMRLTTEQIVKLTGLSISEIEELRA